MRKGVEKGYFLLVVSAAESINGKAISAEEMALRRLNAGMWALYKNTPHKREIQPGDELIIYLAGRNGMRFIAAATAGEVNFRVKKYDADGDVLIGTPDAVLEVQNVRPFKQDVAIHEVKERLCFIPKGTKSWGCVLQRGAKRLTHEDATLILREGGLVPSKDPVAMLRSEEGLEAPNVQQE